jgi:galactokinase
MRDVVTNAFRQQFGSEPPVIARAPGRVNLIGEHTDYNDGFVLPIAIDRAMWIAFRPRDDRQVIAHALEFDETARIDLDALENTGAGWVEYLKGLAWAMQEAGHQLRGWEGVLGGDVPVAAGLSSSAAIEMAVARAFAESSGLAWEPAHMAQLGQKAENVWVGVSSGIMDQMISAAGQKDHALLIDCRSLEYEAVPLPPGTAVVILDTATRRGLVDSAYNERRRQCEAAAEFFGVPALRDVSPEVVDSAVGRMDELTYRRARHIVTENARVIQAMDAMRAGDAALMGQLMDASHISLRDDFEVSSKELDVMAEVARQHDACYGARMTGAGFGGCAVALVRAGDADDFAAVTGRKYEAAAGLKPAIYICTATDGAAIVT